MSWLEVRSEFQGQPDLSPYIEIYRVHGIENTLETSTSLCGCYPVTQGAHERASELAGALRAAGATATSTRDLPEENWELAWRQFFKPRRVGDHMVVRPSWESFEPRTGDVEIVLDPGQAFGTGDHPTTRLCLELMETTGLDGSKLADIGCGSGILAIAACKLGASQVIAVDIESVAIEVARENASLNGVRFETYVAEGLSALPQGRRCFDVIVSNIISAILIRLAPDAADALVLGGTWIVSGIIEQNWPDVQASAQRAGFNLLERRSEDGWVAAAFKNGHA